MSKTFSSAIAAMATAGILLASPVFAAPADGTGPRSEATSQSQTTDFNRGRAGKAQMPDTDNWMNIKQAYDALEKAGYKDTDIRGIYSSRFGYMAHVIDAEENRVRLLIHPTEGTVTVEQQRNRNRDGDRQSGSRRDGDRSSKGSRYHCDN